MKTKVLLIIGLLFIFPNCFSQAFITTWQTIYEADYIRFGAETSGPVSYTWQTLNSEETVSGTFVGPVVTISGLPINQKIRLSIQPQNLKRVFNSTPFGCNCLMDNIIQWGAVEWSSMENAFSFYQSLQISATDKPNLSNVESMKNMFKDCSALNSPFNINSWNISNVTDLSGMFQGCNNFNQALSLWNTSNVNDMSSMFEGAVNFNQNISNWNTSGVINMSKMFKDASAFNKNIANWNTSTVTNMSEMFSNNVGSSFPSAFNQNIGNWNTANVTNMSGMFNGAISFNQNIGNWNTAKVINMSDMFNQAFSFNQNIGNWNTANVTNMSGMFKSDFIFFTAPFATNSLFNNGGSNSIQNWNTANVTDMSGMFFKAEKFNYNLGNWSLNPNVILNEMLDRSGLDCKNYSQTIIGWNNNPITPNNKILGATFMGYGPEAVTAINNLIFNKGWGFSGHDLFSVTPNFSITTAYCEGAVIPSLPTNSTEGISGVWSPELNSSKTTTYTFVPKDGQCATTSALTIDINSLEIPSGDSNQLFNANSTIANITISPEKVEWYASSKDALDKVNQLSTDTVLQNGFTYYAINDNGQCRSQPFAVTTSLSLATNNNDLLAFGYYPNPVNDILVVTATSSVKSVAVYNTMGQLLINKVFDDKTISFDLRELPNSTYIVKIILDKTSKEFKIIKQ